MKKWKKNLALATNWNKITKITLKQPSKKT